MTAVQLKWSALTIFSCLLAMVIPALIRYGLRKAAPPKEESKNLVITPELRRYCARWEFLSLAVFIILMFPCVYLLYRLFTGLAAMHATHLPSAVYTFLPGSAIWQTPALFLGFSVLTPALTIWLRYSMGDKYHVFEIHNDAKVRMNSARALRIMNNAFCVIFTVWIFLALDYYQYVQNDRIVTNDFLSLREEVYLLDEVTDIRSSHAFRNFMGEVIEKRFPTYVVSFSSGQVWSDVYIMDLPAERHKEVVEFISNRSNVPIREVPEFVQGEY